MKTGTTAKHTNGRKSLKSTIRNPAAPLPFQVQIQNSKHLLSRPFTPFARPYHGHP